MLRGHRSSTFPLEEGELKDCMRENERMNMAGIDTRMRKCPKTGQQMSLCGGAGISVPAVSDYRPIRQLLIRATAFCLYIAASARPTSSFISSPAAFAASPMEASTRSLRVPVFPGTE